MLKKDDVILMCYPSKPGQYKIARVMEQPSGHTIIIRCLRRRYKDGTGKAELQKWSIKNAVLLFRPQSQEDKSLPSHPLDYSVPGEEKTDIDPQAEDSQLPSPLHPPDLNPLVS